uniref:Uncharacterized protein n=1 Tax=Myotis myotis TaxID=51298 RepID=A0A7J7WVF5_MYOMY|nr:hypothetical protein mMyoMyo1_011866 [Myotis myotis]
MRSEAGWRGRVTAGLGVRKVKLRQQRDRRGPAGQGDGRPDAPEHLPAQPSAQHGPGRTRPAVSRDRGRLRPGNAQAWPSLCWKHGGNQQGVAWCCLGDEPAAEGGLLCPDSHAKSPEKVCIALVTVSATMWRFGVMGTAFQRW